MLGRRCIDVIQMFCVYWDPGNSKVFLCKVADTHSHIQEGDYMIIIKVYEKVKLNLIYLVQHLYVFPTVGVIF